MGGLELCGPLVLLLACLFNLSVFFNNFLDMLTLFFCYNNIGCI